MFSVLFETIFSTFHSLTYFSRRLMCFSDLDMASLSCLLNYRVDFHLLPVTHTPAARGAAVGGPALHPLHEDTLPQRHGPHPRTAALLLRTGPAPPALPTLGIVQTGSNVVAFLLVSLPKKSPFLKETIDSHCLYSFIFEMCQ